MAEKVRKSNLLMNDVLESRDKLRNLQSEYSDHLGDLALLTKKDLVGMVKKLSNGTPVEEVTKHSKEVFEKIEGTLFDLEEVQSGVDDVIRDMDGWEIKLGSNHAKILEVLNYQEDTLNLLRKDLNALNNDVSIIQEIEDRKSKVEDVSRNLEDILINFSRLQDYVNEAVPRLNKLFDEMDEDFKLSKKYAQKRAL